MLTLYGALNCPARPLLAWALAQEYGLTSLPPLARTPLGKPYFPDRPDLEFSLSHSGRLTLCALSARPVGVDIEQIRPRGASLPRYALTAAEYARFQAAGGDWPAFYTLWTRKEAWCKYTGQGLRRQWGQAPPEEGGFVRTYAGPDWRASVWGEEEPPENIHWKEGGHEAATRLL